MSTIRSNPLDDSFNSNTCDRHSQMLKLCSFVFSSTLVVYTRIPLERCTIAPKPLCFTRYQIRSIPHVFCRRRAPSCCGIAVLRIPTSRLGAHPVASHGRPCDPTANCVDRHGLATPCPVPVVVRVSADGCCPCAPWSVALALRTAI